MAFGELLKTLRTSRRVSQMQLSLDAEVSTRHLSFLETGRASPSREMVLVLGSALELSLRDRNLLLESAGFTAAYKQTALDAPEMAELRHALELILKAHEPFPAVVLDRHWNVAMPNTGFARMGAMLGVEPALTAYTLIEEKRRPNLMRSLVFDMKPMISNWLEVISDMLPRIEREAASDDVTRGFLDEIKALPEVKALERPSMPRSRLVVPVEFALGDQTARLFSTITTLGTAQDVTTQELRIEAFHAADEASRKLLTPLLASDA
ncbi:MAG: helix-turn-helix domain-containing protein [Archangium sp.]